MSTQQTLVPALEAIDFQDGAFFKALSAAFAPLCGGGVPKKSELEVAAGLIERETEKYIGFRPEVTFDYGSTSVRPTFLDHSNVLAQHVGDWLPAEGLSMIRKAAAPLKGMVDLKKSRVSGDLAKIRPFILLDIEHFTAEKFSPEEWAAITLHEIGHVFTMYEMIDRCVQTNQVLAGVDRALKSPDGPKIKKLVIEEAGKKLNFERTVIEAAVEAKDDQTSVTILVSENFKKLSSESGHNFYDTNSWEMMADQFASRHGAGRYIVTSLDRVYKRYGTNTGRTAAMYYIMETLKVVGAVLTAGGIIALFYFGVQTMNLELVWYGFAMMPVLFGFFTSADGTFDGVYDNPLNRAMRCRRQLVDFSRQCHNDKIKVQQITKDIEIIDETIKSYNVRKGWYDTVGYWLSKNSRRRQDIAKFQQELEALAINDLFLKSAQLSTTAA